MSAIKIKITPTGVSLGGWGGDGIHGTDQYQIVEILYPQENANSEQQISHKAGSHIDESDVKKLKEMGVVVNYVSIF